MGRGNTRQVKRGRTTRAARHSPKNYQPRAPESPPPAPPTGDASENPLAGWKDLRVIARELDIPYRDLLRNVPRELVKPLGRRRYVQRARFVEWWNP